MGGDRQSTWEHMAPNKQQAMCSTHRDIWWPAWAYQQDRDKIDVRAHFEKATSPSEQVVEDYAAIPQSIASRVHCVLLCASCYTCRIFVAQCGSVLNGLSIAPACRPCIILTPSPGSAGALNTWACSSDYLTFNRFFSSRETPVH